MGGVQAGLAADQAGAVEVKLCEGYPPGSCMTWIEPRRPLCSWCAKSRRLALPWPRVLAALALLAWAGGS